MRGGSRRNAILLDPGASQRFSAIPAAHVVATSGVMGTGRECHFGPTLWTLRLR
jgi:hypothetical protein